MSTAETPENRGFQADATFLTKGCGGASDQSDRSISDPLSGGSEYGVANRRRDRDEERLTQSTGKRVTVDENNVQFRHIGHSQRRVGIQITLFDLSRLELSALNRAPQAPDTKKPAESGLFRRG